MKTRSLAPLLIVAALFLGACSGSQSSDTLLVMAASSLTESFAEMEAAFEAANPDIDVQINLAGSAALREQILQGAPADVFASANETTMQALLDEGAAETARAFATNQLQIAVPSDNPGSIVGVEDLANDGLLIGLCDQGVPCGDFARQALVQADVEASIDTNEKDVRSLLTKIEVGELDGGIVYRTDVASSGEVLGIDLPPQVDVPIVYPIAVLNDAPNPDAAQRFVDLVASSAGQTILAAQGFGIP